MGIIKHLNILENNEKKIILYNIIPEINDKYEKLSIWSKNKINIETEPILKIVFNKKDELWEIILVIRNWSYNSSNKLIMYVFSDNIKDVFKKYNINFLGDSYVGSLPIFNTGKNVIIYDNINKKEEK